MSELIIPFMEGRFDLRNLYEDVFSDINAEIRWINHGGPAIRVLQAQKYPVILMDLEIAPGERENYSRFEEVIREPRRGCNPDYYKFGLYVLDMIRAEKSVNRNTPVYISSIYFSKHDPICPNAEKLALEHGANGFFSVPEKIDLEILLEMVKKELKL